MSQENQGMIPSWTAGAPINTAILYYPTGDLKTPVPAIVQTNYGNGMVDLIWIKGGTNKQVDGVRNVADEHLKNFPNIARTQGFWDYCEWTRPKLSMIPNPSYVQETAKPVDNRESNQKQRQPVGAR
jgi:hypothetical protein